MDKKKIGGAQVKPGTLICKYRADKWLQPWRCLVSVQLFIDIESCPSLIRLLLVPVCSLFYVYAIEITLESF